jgi:tubulin--tyrosine ligase-like protein 12
MARSMDTWVTSNVDQIVRLVETGPKIAQKYIERPITFKGRKIDLRYVVVLKSLMPLQVYVYDEFFIRFSNNKFTMAESTFHQYDTHFTVMNYDGK